MQSQLPDAFNPRYKSLARGNVLVWLSVVVSGFLSDFPHNKPTLWLILPTLVSCIGTADTIRCIRRRWSFYHAGVIFCIYMDLMAVCMIVFFLIYPYSHYLAS